LSLNSTDLKIGPKSATSLFSISRAKLAPVDASALLFAGTPNAKTVIFSHSESEVAPDVVAFNPFALVELLDAQPANIIVESNDVAKMRFFESCMLSPNNVVDLKFFYDTSCYISLQKWTRLFIVFRPL
jgi:hypothetical protein